MPNHGRSGRCLTCRRRRVKCDEARPVCSPCRRLGFRCGGYAKDYTFRDESHKYASTGASKTTKRQDAVIRLQNAAGEPGRSLLNEADIVVPFFLMQYADMGRCLAVARGFYETLIPTYNSEPQDSPLSLAVSAVAAKVFSLWTDKEEPPSAPYAQAIASLRSTLDHQDHRGRPATALAVLALHLHESISAVYNARHAMPVHHYGALSLLPIAALDSLDDLTSTYVKGFVLHTEISSALRQKRPMHPAACSYVNDPHTSSLVSGNLSSTLDSIGASVAGLQAVYIGKISQRQGSGLLPEQQCRAWITEARRIDELLQAWARDMPDRWRPLRLLIGQDFRPSITAYHSACDVYPSCQIATLWNLWRFHRLLLYKITVGAIHLSTLPQDESADPERPLPTTLQNTIQAHPIQELVDDICHSIPFYLGNRTQPSSLRDFTGPDILFPSHHLLSPGDARIAAWRRDRNGTALSAHEHRRHIVAYGAWHAMSPLSNLLTLVSDGCGGRLVAGCLRAGQRDWIREQFLRVGVLLRLPAAGPLGGKGGRGLVRSLVDVGTVDGGAEGLAEGLAEQVRRGARFMSGP